MLGDLHRSIHNMNTFVNKFYKCLRYCELFIYILSQNAQCWPNDAHIVGQTLQANIGPWYKCKSGLYRTIMLALRRANYWLNIRQTVGPHWDGWLNVGSTVDTTLDRHVDPSKGQ